MDAIGDTFLPTSQALERPFLGAMTVALIADFVVGISVGTCG
jgi:hypothetical protein